MLVQSISADELCGVQDSYEAYIMAIDDEQLRFARLATLCTTQQQLLLLYWQ